MKLHQTCSNEGEYTGEGAGDGGACFEKVSYDFPLLLDNRVALAPQRLQPPSDAPQHVLAARFIQKQIKINKTLKLH